MKRTALLAIVAGLLPALAQAATRVASDSNCPSAEAISQRLLGLVAAGGPTAASARVHSEGEMLRIEVSTPGEGEQARSLPAVGGCDERAELAALVIAAWLDALPASKIAAPGIPPRERPSTALVGGGPPVEIDTRALLGAGCFASADALGPSAGLAVIAAMPHLIEAFGLTAEAALGLPRQMGLGDGTVHFLRPTFALAGSGELGGRRWTVRPQAGIVLGVLRVRGSGFADNNGSATTTTWGGVGGATLVRAWQGNELWLRLDGMAWPQGRAARSRQLPTDVVIEAPLPEWELRLTAGYSFGVH